MSQVFLCYSAKDYFFAELAASKLRDGGVDMWRDQGRLRPGSDWHHGIEQGIAESSAVLVALSANSAQSPYVTFEWAYALGKGKTIIPLKLTECEVHPRLQPIQHLDFTVARALPWDSLIKRVQEVEVEAEAGGSGAATPGLAPTDAASVREILGYLNRRGYQMASFGRLREHVASSLTDEAIGALIARNPSVFRRITTKGGNPGLAKLVP